MTGDHSSSSSIIKSKAFLSKSFELYSHKESVSLLSSSSYINKTNLAGINFGGSKMILNLAGINFGGSQKKFF